jgi:competence protein ComEC
MSNTLASNSATENRKAPLLGLLVAVCAGIVADRAFACRAELWWVASAAAWLTWQYLWRAGRDRRASFAILLCVAALGAAWHHLRWQAYAADELGLFATREFQPVALEAIATSGARRIPAPPFDPLATLATPERTRLELRALAIRDREVWRPTSGQAQLVVDGQLLGVRPGDHVQVFGTLARLEPPGNPGEFDFASQARISRRLCSLRSEFPQCVTTIARGGSLSPTAWINRLRIAGETLLMRSLSPAQSGLATAMFLGARDELEPDQAQAFLETGTIHLLVISGLNVAILAASLFFALRLVLVPRGWALAAVVSFCVLYAVVTDAQPPVVRATVMILIGCVAVRLGRQALGFNSLAAAGLVVLGLNPSELFQSGTQLSFLSVAVLVWLNERSLRRAPLDPLDRLLARTRPWHERATCRAGQAVFRALLASALIWLVICPLVMSRFHLCSPVAIVVGPALALPVTAAMASGFGIFACGWFAPALGVLLGRFCDWNLSLMEAVVGISRTWPGGHVWLPGPEGWWLAGFYAGLAAVAMARGRWFRLRWGVAALSTWIIVGLAAHAWTTYRQDGLRCTFLSVGHGAAVVAELPSGQTLLYDAGRLGSPVLASRAISSFLWSRGITHLDAVVISHADADHYNALPALLKQFSCGAVYVSPVMFLGRGRALEALRTALDQSGIPLREVWSGDRLRLGGGATAEVLHPPRTGVFGSDNANSIVLALEYENRRVLLTGDLEPPGLEDVMAEVPTDCDVLLAPHHGSASSDQALPSGPRPSGSWSAAVRAIAYPTWRPLMKREELACCTRPTAAPFKSSFEAMT